MGLWIGMLLISLLIPGVMLLCGRMLRTSPPEDINAFFGYRTRRSMRSREAWDFAQGYAGKIWQKLGLWTLIGSVGLMLLLLGKDAETVARGIEVLLALQLVSLLAVIPLTERALKKRFGSGEKPDSGETS